MLWQCAQVQKVHQGVEALYTNVKAVEMSDVRKMVVLIKRLLASASAANVGNLVNRHFKGFMNKQDEIHYKDVLDFILETNSAIVEDISKKLKLSYACAARIVDTMESEGILGPYQGPKRSREIFIKKEDVYQSANHSYENQSSYQEQSQTKVVETPHEILGVSSSATKEEIKHAYKTKMKEYHPDKTATLGEKLRALAEEESKRITNAYQEICKAKGFN